ncbi:MAG: cell division protein FtsA [Methylobacteriaceae bacterium]|nr:cell division protein FtsA [Methylobacteriaceae bacterium]
MRPLPARKSAILSVLDVGTSKIVCLVARLAPMAESDLLPGRTHRCRVIGIGHQRARGIKAGVVVDMEEAEQAIRCAVDAAERMAGVEVEGVIVNVTGGRLSSQHYAATAPIGGRAVAAGDVHQALAAACASAARQGRAVLHSLPTDFSLDGTPGIRDPKGMVGEALGADLHVVSAETAAARNLMLAIERCHLRIEAMVATPYASGLAALVDDEAEMGAAVVDMGGGTTSIGVFERGRLTHVDAVAVGGHHVTMDVARGLTVRVADAERLKTQHGACVANAADERESIAVVHAGDEADRTIHLPKSQLVRIIRPRVEEILELARDRLKAAGFAAHAGRRLVLTGGASQLAGLVELARETVSSGARQGRPLGAQGLPDSAKSPAFAAAVGLLVYPQIAGVEHFEPTRGTLAGAAGDGYVARVGRWLKESF